MGSTRFDNVIELAGFWPAMRLRDPSLRDQFIQTPQAAQPDGSQDGVVGLSH
jgi:hypothetical protein